MQTAVINAKAAGQTELLPKQRAGFEAAYTRITHEGLRANPPSPPTGKAGHRKQTPTRNLLEPLPFLGLRATRGSMEKPMGPNHA